MTTFDWLASESAPEQYPMKIVTGDFVNKDGGSLYVPNGKRVNRGWGNSVSTHVVGARLKPLPHRLDITFFSYTENSFYQGQFELPYDSILSLFQNGYYSTKAGEQATYDAIIAGVSPGGGVAVWLEGLNKTTQVFYGKADKAYIPWKRISNTPDESREEYLSASIEDAITPEALKSLKTNGVPLGLWDSYQTRYHWLPNFITENRPPKNIEEIVYVNGEKDQLFYPIDPANAEASRAAPKYFYYSWQSPDGKPLAHHFYFDTEEVMAAFEKLEAIKPASAASPVLLTIKLTEHQDGRKIDIALQHQEQTIMLTKTGLKQYTSSIGLEDKDSFYQD